MAGIKKFFSDFKDFAMKGNIMDMAVGVVIGGAFGKIVTSLVNDIITPFISLLTGSVTLTELKHVFRPEVLNEAGEVLQAEVALTYGNFIQTCIDFLIIAFSIFVVIRLMGAARTKMEQLKKKEEEAAAEEEPAENELAVLQEIRELLKETQKQ
ncbi:MAG: large-conductance mechanosensitive channel protein MscL [Clostridia bacterium]|nr:large-conductance mechanosensitive channel protein MscL [Clostridia bacterium]MBR3974802.1 large-conductance mechanosensitive channel protein MscL [Clostridia bacterium]